MHYQAHCQSCVCMIVRLPPSERLHFLASVQVVLCAHSTALSRCTVNELAAAMFINIKVLYSEAEGQSQVVRDIDSSTQNVSSYRGVPQVLYYRGKLARKSSCSLLLKSIHVALSNIHFSGLQYSLAHTGLHVL
eukprot:GHVQ01013506.1.p1 GENE.GHVQ01013506.1~~GHVQ01013506.1.p1  ORF type:complete len:134 (-),score=0.60 GHVQ01013506.1:308-709(-)